MLEDDNNTLHIAFEVANGQEILNRRFAVTDLQVFPVGCAECANYPFSYDLRYNYDRKLKVEVSFNRAYLASQQ